MHNLDIQEKIRTEGVEAITGPGTYFFSVGQFPNFQYRGIPDHIQERFPEIVGRRFIPASTGLYFRKKEPAELKVEEDWPMEATHCDTVFLKLGKQYCEISTDDHGSQGDTRGRFHLQDIGNVYIRNNDLVIARKSDLDGKIEMEYSGTVPHFHAGGRHWSNYTVEVSGDSPGYVVAATIDFINTELQKAEIQLVKRV